LNNHPKSAQQQRLKSRVVVQQSSQLIVTCAEDIQSETVEWLWPSRIAKGKLTLFAGIQGKGKSFAAIDLAARISRGAPFPDGCLSKRGTTIILAAEDEAADITVPRLEAQKADLSRIQIVKAVTELDRAGNRSFNLIKDTHLLSNLIAELGDVEMLIVDPIDSHIGTRIDTRDNIDVRQMLEPLMRLVTRCGIAVVGVCHLNESPQPNALFEVCGSIACAPIARSVWFVCDDPGDDARRLFICGKMSSATMPLDLAFSIGNWGTLKWHDDRLKYACDWLKKTLADAPMRAFDVVRLAVKAGISNRMLKRARSKVGVRSNRLVGNGRPEAWWTLSTDDADLFVPDGVGGGAF